MARRFDHLDLRVRRLEEVRSFYETLLPALGFTRRVEVEGWLQYEAPDHEGGLSDFFGVTESAGHTPNETRIAFWAESRSAVDVLAGLAARSGAQAMEGPIDYEPGYYAAFFEDPSGNRLEICHRVRL